MWRSRNNGKTGSNSIPLGRRRLDSEPRETLPLSNGELKRSPSPPYAYKSSPQFDNSGNVERGRRRFRIHYWDGPTPIEDRSPQLLDTNFAITACMTSEQLALYSMNIRLEEVSQKLRIGAVVPNRAERSPSPPPQYDNFGRRLNTREIRHKKKLEDERHKIIKKAMKLVPGFRAPSDYRRPTKTQEKVYVPVKDYPEINFIGLLIGPRGHTLKDMEAKSGAKIAIRGKGSVKEGKGRSDPSARGNMEEDLHCLVMADSEEKVNHAIKLIEEIIQTAASVPEGQNDLKRSQLRQLATLNGTLRDDENQVCQNCGNVGHRKYDCPERSNYTANIICRYCNNAGHIARDCPVRNGKAPASNAVTDQEYQNLMQELNEGSRSTTAPPEAIEYRKSERESVPPPWINASATPASASTTSAPWNKPPPAAPAAPAAASNPPWQANTFPGAPAAQEVPSFNAPSSAAAPPWQAPVPGTTLPPQPVPFFPPAQAPPPPGAVYAAVPPPFTVPNFAQPGMPGAVGVPSAPGAMIPPPPGLATAAPGVALPPGVPPPPGTTTNPGYNSAP
ncbi:zinc finger protein Bpb1 [Schizosaccharomyces japonicus yFS275]|uniref:Branchpoint-bridging protein n=1 Tax=Schizosaccharomyces japonicus (strain yFS275 / FY16936) TaxID=402676 RepID=B6JV47_SCHJY|nr:zinc finger protein Bpb1 [Schizosaccharomyces japonicus yFS275]EEB05248.1 zinc finger protein Bpb1 [Schizosaccharomyces japonicus yFS275]